MKLSTIFAIAIVCLSGTLCLESCVSSDTDLNASQALTRYINFDGNSEYRINPSKSPMTTHDLKIADFNRIDACFVNVVVTVGKATGKARLEAPANIIDYIDVTSKNGLLRVSLKEVMKNGKHVNIDGPINATLYVTTPCVEDISVRLSTCVKFDNGFTVEDIDIETSTSGQVIIPSLSVGTCDFTASTSGAIKIGSLSSTGKCKLDTSTSGTIEIENVQTSSLKADSSTSGAIVLKKGQAKKVGLTASTSGSIRAQGLSAQSGNLSASTSGSLRCNVADVLSINESTGGTIRNR